MKLTKNSVSIVENIVDFTCALVFKDEVKAFEMETQESAVKASEYLSAYLKTDSLNEIERKVIIDNYKELNKYYKELLDDYGIQPYISRLAKDLDIIYQPEKMVLTHGYLYYYRTIYKQCLQSFYVTSYSPAMIAKDNYREFCLLSINLMAFVQLLNRWLENPYDINLMTEFQIDKFMISFGVSFFTGLPFKYKQIIARNLNRLIINKGTDKVVIDILELFGFSEININKYYLIRQAVTEQDSLNNNLDYRNTDTHDVFFISHNINLPSLNYAVKHNLYTKHTYEQIIESDNYWKVSKEEVKSLDFSFVETKYFSIDTGFNLNVEVMNTTLLINLLKRIRTDYETKEKLDILSNFINENVPAKIEDVIIALQVLMCEYQGLEDTIQYDLVGIAKTFEFAKYDPLNLNLNLMEAIPKIKNVKDIELSDLRSFSTFGEPEVLSIYNQNINVKQNFEKLISNETSYHNYKKLRTAHNAKFYQTINYTMFGTHPTFSSYLKTRNSSLYKIITDIRGISDTAEKTKALENMISNLTDIVTDALQNFSIFLGATSLDILLSYMRTAILAFKSFTTSLLDLNVFIIIGETYETRLLDGLERMTAFVEHKNSKIRFEDKQRLLTSLPVKSKHLLNDVRNLKTAFTLYDRPLQPTLIYDAVVLQTVLFTRDMLLNKEYYQFDATSSMTTEVLGWDTIKHNGKIIQEESVENQLTSDRIVNIGHFRKNSLAASIDKFLITSLPVESSRINIVERFDLDIRSMLETSATIAESVVYTSKIKPIDILENRNKIQFLLNMSNSSIMHTTDYLKLNKTDFFIEKINLDDVFNAIALLKITDDEIIRDEYTSTSFINKNSEILLNDDLKFHKDSVTYKYSELPILVEEIILTPFNVVHDDSIIFADMQKIKTTLDVQSRNYLIDTYTITQVTYA